MQFLYKYQDYYFTLSADDNAVTINCSAHSKKAINGYLHNSDEKRDPEHCR